MDSCISLLQSKSSPDNCASPVKDALHKLVGLLERPEYPGVDTQTNCESTEELLMDIELNGVRYMLIRMPPPLYSRAQLSPREQEIVRMVAQGHPNKVIADILNISAWTVCTHLRRIFAKLGVGSRAAMVAHLPELGMARKDQQIRSPLR